MEREVILADTLGFCGGVKAAVRLAEGEAEKPDRVFTLGPLVHNRQVQSALEEKNVACLEQGDPLPEVGTTVIIRSHGVPPSETERLAKAGLKVLDGTCAKVKKSQQRIASYASRGYSILIAGEKDHGEVLGLQGYAPGSRVISRVEELDQLALQGPVFLTCQTTFPEKDFLAIEKRFRDLYPQGEVVSALCKATERRQKALRNLIPRVEVIVVVGGKHSSNTRNLYEIARESGKTAYWVEQADELDLKALKPFVSFGITAGASTPDFSVDRVVQRLKSF